MGSFFRNQPIGNEWVMNGTPEGTRTPNLLIRSQTIYPIDLRVPCVWRGGNKPGFAAGVKDFSAILAGRGKKVQGAEAPECGEGGVPV